MSGTARVAALAGLLAAGVPSAGCGTCRPGPAVTVQPRVGGAIGSSGASTWSSPGVGIDVSQLLCRPPDAATQPQPGPGSPPIPDVPRSPAPAQEKAPDSTPL